MADLNNLQLLGLITLFIFLVVSVLAIYHFAVFYTLYLKVFYWVVFGLPYSDRFASSYRQNSEITKDLSKEFLLELQQDKSHMAYTPRVILVFVITSTLIALGGFFTPQESYPLSKQIPNALSSGFLFGYLFSRFTNFWEEHLGKYVLSWKQIFTLAVFSGTAFVAGWCVNLIFQNPSLVSISIILLGLASGGMVGNGFCFWRFFKWFYLKRIQELD